MTCDPLMIDDVFGTKWQARIRRDHERHAGIPDYGYCPGRGPRADVAPITSAMLARQRATFRHARYNRYVTIGPVVHGEQFPRGYTRAAALYEQRTRLVDAATTRTDTGTADG